MRITGRIGVAALSAALCVVGVTACTGEVESGNAQQTEPGPAERLASAKVTLDAATSVHLTLTSADIPKDQDGVVSADGWGAHPPAFKGTFKVKIQGIEADAEVTAIGADVWAKLPLIPGTNKINPADYGLPNPADFFSTDRGLTTLLTSTTSPTAGDQVRKGSEVLNTISGSVPGSAVVGLLKTGDTNGTFAATYSLTDTQELREAKLVGPFFGSGASSTYTLTLDQYGVPVTIETP